MRHVLLMLVMFTFSTPAITQPLTHRLLEIRSMPVAQKKTKPIRHLLHRIDRMIRGKTVSNYFPLGRDIPNRTLFLSMTLLIPLPLMTTIIVAATTPTDAVVEPIISVTGLLASWFGAVAIPAWYGRREWRTNEMVGQHIHFTKLQDGRPILLRGLVLEKDNETGELVVQTRENGKLDSTHVLHFDIGGVDIPGHPDLHRSVRLITNAEDYDYLYVAGAVSKVYNDGHYEIEIKHKVDYNLNEYTVDEPYTIFVHASLPEVEGGLVFMDGGKATDYVDDEAEQLAASAKQADFAHDNNIEEGSARVLE